MDYLYKITVEIDDEKVLSLQQHDLDAVYKTVREAFVGCNFKEVPTDNKQDVYKRQKFAVFTVDYGKIGSFA